MVEQAIPCTIIIATQGNLFQAVSPHTIRGHKAWRCTALKRLQPLLMSGLSRHQARTSCRRYPRKQVSPLIHALAVAGQSAPSPSASTAPASELHLSPQRRLRSTMRDTPRANSTGKSPFFCNERSDEGSEGRSLSECSRPRCLLRRPCASSRRVACSSSARANPGLPTLARFRVSVGGTASAQMSGGSRTASGDEVPRQLPRAGSTSPAPMHGLHVVWNHRNLIYSAWHLPTAAG